MLSTCLNSENKHIMDIKLDHMMTTTNVWCSMDQCNWALYNHKTSEFWVWIIRERTQVFVESFDQLSVWVWIIRPGEGERRPLKCFLSFLFSFFFFYRFFLFSLNSEIYLLKKKKKSQNGVISAPLTVKANWVLMEYYIDKN